MWRDRLAAAEWELVWVRVCYAVLVLIATGVWITNCVRRGSKHEGSGLAGGALATSIFGLWTLGLFAPLGIFLSAVALVRGPRGVALAGLLAGVLGVGFLFSERYSGGRIELLETLVENVEEFETLGDVSAYYPGPLYLRASPHPSLYIEVDWVARAKPEKAVWSALVEFLETHCEKPGGIQLVLSTAIEGHRRDASPEELAMEYMDGPPSDRSGPAPAYLYVLYFRSGVVKTDGTYTAAHVSVSDYPGAIFADADVIDAGMKQWSDQSDRRDFQKKVLLHEAAHALGISPALDRGTGLHCADPTCLLFPRVARNIELRALCARCLDDLEAVRARDVPMAFDGPILTRKGEGYAVFRLPGWALVSLGGKDPFRWPDLLEEARKSLEEDENFRIGIRLPLDKRMFLDALAASMSDPQPWVSSMMKECEGLARKLFREGRRFAEERAFR